MKHSFSAIVILGFALLWPHVTLAELHFSERQLQIRTDLDGPRALAQIDIKGIAPDEPWVAAPDATWLQIVPSQGRGPASLTLRVRSGALGPGHYKARIYARSAEVPLPLQSVQVDYLLGGTQGVSVVSGSGQQGIRGQQLDRPFVARLSDAEGKPLSNVELTFRTTVGRTEPMSQSLRSDANGLVSFRPVALDYGAVVVHAEADLPGAAARFDAVISGRISTFAGDGIRAYGGDGGPATQAHLNAPFGMAFVDDKFLIVDYFNHALRQIDMRSGVIEGLV